ncbi:MAG: DNA starvation/stationary phase protection protein [Bacteroidota bacterium]
MINEPLQPKEAYQGNSVGLDQAVAEKMGNALDRHLASMLVLYQQYHKHHWVVEGPQFRDLHLFFEEHYNQLHGIYDQVAERLTVLGVIPTCHPTKVVELSYVEHEAEGVFSVREMIQNDLEAEKKIAIELRKTFKEAIEHGDIATSYLVQEVTFKTEDRAQHLQHFLEDDTLEEEFTVKNKTKA